MQSDARANSKKEKETSSKEEFDIGQALQSAIKRWAERFAGASEQHWQGDSQDKEKPADVNINIAEVASRVAHNREEFRKIKEAIKKSGMVTNFAVQQILPEIIKFHERKTMEKSSCDSCQDSRNDQSSSHVSLRDSPGSSSLNDLNTPRPSRRGPRGSLDCFSLEKDKSGAYKWKLTSTVNHNHAVIKQTSVKTIRAKKA